ncbi:MAG: C69 family dipeptidase [Bacteroidales bacterium]|nr:C69 family dipeptidase [Bacteroidales bacterium]
MRKTFLMMVLAGLIGMLQTANACTNFIVTKGASKTGATYVTYSADSHGLYGELYYRPAAEYAEGTMVDIYEWDTGKYLGKIKQVRKTYSVVGNMNEFQLTIGETTYGGRPELVDSTGIMDYGSLIYTTLQRAKTAREAVRIMTDLMTEYGYSSSGESFSIVDPNEAWILEVIGKGSPVYDKKGRVDAKQYSKGAVWVARRVPDGYISGHANQARITTFPLNDKENCIYSKDVITFARQKGYFNGKDEEFSFADTYAPLDFGALRFCEARVWAGFRKVCKAADDYFPYINGEDFNNRLPLWMKPDHKVSLEDVFGMMRDHYTGTPYDMTKDVGAGPYGLPYRWRPMVWEHKGETYVHERAISTQQTGFSFVAEMRSWLPDHIGGVNWFGVDDTYLTVYVPMYCGITSAPRTFEVGNGDMGTFTFDAAFWVFNWVSSQVYTRWKDMIVDVQKVQKQLESQFKADVLAFDNIAIEAYKKDPINGRNMLTEFSHQRGDYTTMRWKKLGEFLMVKYLDGNLKKEENGKFIPDEYNVYNPSFPPYSDEWYGRIVNEHSKTIKMREVSK